MCGIAGILDLRNPGTLPDRITQMIGHVPHRGPDGRDTVVVGPVALGHGRLSIIDLSNAASQPMSDQQGRATLTFNGALYNYLELRAELESFGRTFVTSSDTEVLLQAYLHWGENCVDHFNGMWSFAILDLSAGKIFCARDRFGEKPFYYVPTDHGVMFASEIRQLLPEMHAVKGNRDLLNRFLLGVVGEDETATFYKDIQKLPRGHTMTIDVESGYYKIHRYYQVMLQDDIARLNFADARDACKELLRNSIDLRLRADVRVGTCLSGGLDSSSIAALASSKMAASSYEKFRAITACSTEAANDESVYASQVVDHCGLEWIRTTPAYDDFAASIDDVVRVQEEPFGSASIVMQYFVMKAASNNGIKVLLDGQGGDEIFLGYERYVIPYFISLAKRGRFAQAVKEIGQITHNNSVLNYSTLLKYMVYFGSASIRDKRVRNRGSYLREIPDEIAEIRNFSASMKSLFDMQKYEIETSNLPSLLRFEDKNSMWHSIETRLPLLDHRIVELGCSLQAGHKIRGGWTKFILREAVKDALPDSIVWRKNKLGFTAPQATWAQLHRTEMIENIRQSAIVKELTDLKALEANDFSLDANSFWRLFSVAKWEQAFSVT